MAGFALQGSELDWAYSTVPNPNTGNRIITLPADKTLGGGSVLNYGGWARGYKSDYDEWARIVGDERRGYEGLLPYLKRSGIFRKDEADPTQHGTKGPIRITSVTASDPKRKYPLRAPLQKAWQELDAQQTSSSAGNLAGLSESLENWD
ncbi:hypothetical protein DSL72_002549 [Monilinia vaccinii-corymbosi]|uniref:Glucose-methanol-choline oxidoreductase N-terminal domain-containing protein n=1 Tax=Monilinia vaccinii-corymbosi TaxID=61207 RepID=A0A8A3PD01_9HELO|nr:hypothetical protein DSL72_002549 [Monilinia vaccinii-corymbosi]